MTEDLQQHPTIGASWEPPAPDTELAVALTINVPEHAGVRRNALTGQVQIDGISIADLVNLRDSINEQIIELERQALEIQSAWEQL